MLIIILALQISNSFHLKKKKEMCGVLEIYLLFMMAVIG